MAMIEFEDHSEENQKALLEYLDREAAGHTTADEGPDLSSECGKAVAPHSDAE
jgi:hypothetical protein